jgi:hypothetical protein
MKKVINIAVAKAPVKMTVAKKPMLKYGGAKKPLRKAQDGISFKDKSEALKILNQNPRTEIVGGIDYYNKLKNQSKEFYNQTPVDKGMQRGPLDTTFEDSNIERKTNQLKYRDAAEQYVRNYDKNNPVGSLKTKPAMSINKKGGTIKKVTAKKVMVKSKKK